MTTPIVIERPNERIAHLILNRPERRNALTGPLVDQLGDAVLALNDDADVNVIVVRGAGNAFCSGLDLTEFGADPQPDWVPSFGAKWRRVHKAIFDSTKIFVGALERAAVNGGAALALACDFLVAGETAFLQVGEIQQGMAAPMNMAWLRLRHPEAVAARLALVGDRIPGPDLVRIGVALEAVPDDQVLNSVDSLATRLGEHAPAGVRRIKSGLRSSVVTETGEQWLARFLQHDPLGGPAVPVAAKDR